MPTYKAVPLEPGEPVLLPHGAKVNFEDDPVDWYFVKWDQNEAGYDVMLLTDVAPPA